MTQHSEHGKSSATPQETVKQFTALHWAGVLSTISRTVKGFPFGSVVPYDIDEQGRIYIFISLISEHFRNLQDDPRASICVPEAFGLGDVQANARATLVGEFTPVPEEEARDSYWRRFPHSPERSLAHDFVFWRCAPLKIRWIGGFGEIRWVSGGDYKDARFDPVAYSGRAILDHMNADHQDALSELLQGYAGVAVPPQQCRMSGVDTAGFQISYRAEPGLSRVRLLFPAPAQTPAQVRDAIIDMLKKTRAYSGGLED